MTDSTTKPDQSKDKPRGKNAVEWIVFGLSCALVTLVLGYLTYLMLANEEETVPRFKVSIGQSRQREGQIWVPVTVENRGTVTANNVEVEVKSKDGQSAGFTLPHVPRRGERRGWVGFDAPLAHEELKARVTGYQAP